MEVEARRVRRIRPTAASKVRAKGKLMDESLLDGYLKVIADNNKEIAALQKEQNDALAVLLKTMQANKLKNWEIPDARAEVVIPQGRSSSVIDPENYYKLVSKEDFFESIKVSIEKAKKHLGTKELAKITEVTPGKRGEPTLSIEYR
jgi:hypothetical protein